MAALVPYVEAPRRGSRYLVNEFLKSKENAMKVDISSTGRGVDTVYSSLLVYLKRHVEFDAHVKLIEGDVVLFRGRDEGQ